MKVYESIDEFAPSSSPITLTIGNFDGVHLGHQAILKHASAILTFSNHPAEALYKKTIPRLTTLEHRLSLFNSFSIDSVILISFTEAFSKQTAEEFLIYLKKRIPFQKLVLGHDAVIGHERKGNAAVLKDLSQKLGFDLEYVSPFVVDDVTVSSSHIRQSIHNGDLKTASFYLGRPYSIRGCVEPGTGQGGKLGFHTANISVENLCIPPHGVYAVTVLDEDRSLKAVANLGYAPTMHNNRPPLLEVHIPHTTENLYGKEIEIVFHQFLRSEKRFESIKALKLQIQKDINQSLSLPFIG